MCRVFLDGLSQEWSVRFLEHRIGDEPSFVCAQVAQGGRP